ncbi:MAG: hypothetical protein V4450_13230 [Bacteroidota bacterium]
MKKRKQRTLIKEKQKELWKHYRQIADWAERLDYLGDAATIRKTKQQSLPPSMLPMLF